MKPSGRLSFPSRLWTRLALAAASAAFAAAAPTDVPAADAKKPDVEKLIRLLADNDYRTREKATLELWQLGTAVLPELHEASGSRDPETVHRALELIRKIDLHIGPTTDPQIIDLVERYDQANRAGRADIFVQLHQLGAWRQLLRLFATETDPELRQQVQQQVERVALQAARERIAEDDSVGAREILELAPANPQTLLALADFHRVHGTWPDELERAEKLTTPAGAAWRLALHRAAGNPAEAATAAKETDDPQLAMICAALAGDPLPWLLAASQNGTAANYATAAVARWQGKQVGQDKLAPLLRALERNSPTERAAASAHLFLLGEPEAAERHLSEISRFAAFRHFAALERLDEAIAALEIDPEQPDISGWVAARMERFVRFPDEPEALEDVLRVAAFLEERGLEKDVAGALRDPLAKLAERDLESFLSYLSVIFSGSPSLAPAPGIAARVAAGWAGDDEEKWEEARIAAFSDSPEVEEFWTWLGELDPEATLAERFQGLMALCNLGKDPRNLRQRWLDLAWAGIDAADGEARETHLGRILRLTSTYHEDAAAFLRAWEMLPEERQADYESQQLVDRLLAVGRWREAADRVAAAAEKSGQLGVGGHAYAAGVLRLAGREAAAAKHDRMAERLALGDPAAAEEIARSYARSSDFRRAASWSIRTLEWSDADYFSRFSDEPWTRLLECSGILLEAGNWERSAATSEIASLILAKAASSLEAWSGLGLLRTRSGADLSRGMALLESDRKRALTLLDKAHANIAGDGSLADHFFPAVRAAGLVDRHDAWFATSWQLLAKSLARYPDSDNTLNTAGWIAGRAARRLSEAEAMMENALSIRPNQPAYLDTMAEIHFASGQRDEAVRWSALALNFQSAHLPDPLIWKQFLRFQNAPLPR